MIYLVGGPPHQDMFDLKPEAPKEIAGPWRPIATNVPGFEICEAFPRLARLADKLTVIRSLVGNQADHDAIQVFNGHDPQKPKPGGGWPQFGSTVSKVAGAGRPASPPFVSLCYTCTHGPYNEPGPGFLGPVAFPVPADGPTRERHGPQRRHAGSARRPEITAQELRRHSPRRRSNGDDDRRSTPSPNRRWGCSPRRSWPRPSISRGKTRASSTRYGTGDPKIFMDGNGAPRVPQSLLLARRLIEAGVRVVTLNYSKWDWHGGLNAEGRANNSIFLREAEDFPVFDQCVSALVEDLHQRGLDDDCAVVILGEFGRTPKISAQVGRDHWPQVNCALLAGGGMRTGR